ncbi:hypothetical protein [Tateyamaria sp. SN6-1]|uniref:hypothetical protein n=1 Tax=Tateyamaria sp. SN6-1 TaxID=3092148 RepID=UPI0039F557E1
MDTSFLLSSAINSRLDIDKVFVWQQLAGALCNLLKRNRHEIPDIDADIDGIAGAQPVVVDMAEHVQRLPPRVVPGDHRIVAQCVRLSVCPISYFGQVMNAVPRQRQCGRQAMVADDQVFFRSGQLLKDLRELCFIFGFGSKRKVADNPKLVLGLHNRMHVFQQNGIHFIDRLKWAIAE